MDTPSGKLTWNLQIDFKWKLLSARVNINLLKCTLLGVHQRHTIQEFHRIDSGGKHRVNVCKVPQGLLLSCFGSVSLSGFRING